MLAVATDRCPSATKLVDRLSPENRSPDPAAPAGRVLVPLVDRSTTAANSGELGGHAVDRSARRLTEANQLDESHHLAKVRVAGSNPVFRSNELPGQWRLLHTVKSGPLQGRDG